MTDPTLKILASAAALLAAVPGSALVIQGGSIAGLNERFSAGFPTAPVANTSTGFLGAGFDFSGIGWLTASPQFSLTLISPQHFLITSHTAPSTGASVSFLNQAGVLKSYTVDSTYHVNHSAGVDTDIAIGRLAAPIAHTDFVSALPVLMLDSYADYLNRSLLVYGKNGRVGLNTVDNFYLADMLPFGGGNGVVDSVLFSTDLDPAAGQSQGEAGDSGSPSLYLSGSSLSIVGIHSAIDTMPLNDLTYDSFIPTYASQINGRLALDGYSLGMIPEPSTYALWAGAAILGLAHRLRSRRARP